MKARSRSGPHGSHSGFRPADGISVCALLLGGGVGGVLVFTVALPLALSSPFPTPREGAWIIGDPPLNVQPAIAGAGEATQAQQVEAPLVMAALEDPGEQPMTFVERWNRRVPQAAIDVPAIDVSAAGEEAAEAPEAAPQTSPLRTPEPASRPRPSPPAKAAPAPRRAAVNPLDEVDRYLWEVYQREPVKSDSTGDFTWKDKAAAKRLGMSLKTYVIGGMDPDFREQLYHAGRAMDADGLRWSILSAFRDDYRQRIAAGFKAHGGNSLHGGSKATGGYGHGRAIDITSADGDADAIWHWIDVHGAKFGLFRPMRRIDPAHIQPRRSFHDLAHDLREARLKRENRLARRNEGTKLAAQVEK